MRAITLERFDSGPELHGVPTPPTAPSEVLIRVHASSFGAFDIKIAIGMLKGMLEYEFL